MFMRMISVVALVCTIGLFAPKADAVAFKMKNDSQYSMRIRVYDRGNWRQWVTFNPGGWGDCATQVERAVHTVEIQVWNGSSWQPLYYGNHGSRLWTRIVQAYNDNNGTIFLAWWDEPGGGCRDQPPHPVYGGSSCLKPSGGWMWSMAYKLARKAGEAYVLGG